MDSKIELTKSQLETILRLINDVNLRNSQNGTKTNERLISNRRDDKNAMKLSNRNDLQSRKSNLSKKRSYSAINLNNLNNVSNDLLNESFKESITKLLTNSTIGLNEKFPKIQTNNQSNRQTNEKQSANKLKRNKSLIELKKEKWDRERNELKDSDSWYEKFDSFKKSSYIDRSRSQPNMLINYEDESRLFSPLSNFDNESIALTNSYTTIDNLTNHTHAIDQFKNHQLNQSNRSNEQISRQSPISTINQFSNSFKNDLINQPRKSFRRYAHSLNNINLIEKRRKQNEYQAQLDHQLAHKKEQENIRKQNQMLEDRKFEEKILIDQAELRKEFELDHNGLEYVNELANTRDKRSKIKRVDRKSLNELERLEMKSKELIKVFKEASTQTDEQLNRRKENEMKQISTQTNELMLNKWQSSSSMLQPVMVRSNRSALLRTVTRPKWLKQTKDEDKTQNSILPQLNQKANQFQARKKWNV